MRKKIFILFILCYLITANCYSQSSANCDGGGGGQGPGGGDGGGGGGFTEGVGSADPNLILSPVGFDTVRWVSINDNMGFAIYFENDPQFATAPAHNVYIYYRFNTHQDATSFRLGNFGFNGMIFTVPPGLNYYQTRLDLRDSLGLYVDLTAGINIITNTAFWIFQSIDPLTNQPPINPLTGFLPVKDSALTAQSDTVSAKGEGFVYFTIKPLATSQTRDMIFAQAKIVFDINDTIPTNIEFNTVDAVAPVSSIYIATVSQNTISLFWSGADDPGGSGVKEYLLFVSQNGSPFTFYKQFTGLTTDFIGVPGITYCFFIMARDNVDNLEAPLKDNCEVSVTLSGGTPVPLTWLYFTGQEKTDDVELNWATGSEINTAYFSVERSLNGRDFEQIGSVTAAGNSSQTSTYQWLDKDALQLNTLVIYYRLRQADLDGKFTYSNIIMFRIGKDNGQVVKVYPNPFSQNITVQISTETSAVASDLLELYSVNGVLIYRKSLANRQNNVPIVLNDLPPLASGTYILHTNLNGINNSIKIIKQ